MFEKEVTRQDGSVVKVIASSQEELDEALLVYGVPAEKPVVVEKPKAKKAAK